MKRLFGLAIAAGGMFCWATGAQAQARVSFAERVCDVTSYGAKGKGAVAEVGDAPIVEASAPLDSACRRAAASLGRCGGGSSQRRCDSPGESGSERITSGDVHCSAPPAQPMPMPSSSSLPPARIISA